MNSPIRIRKGFAVAGDFLEDPSVSELYHENSKLGPFDYSLYRWISSVNNDVDIREVISHPEPGYPGSVAIRLPDVKGKVSKYYDVLRRRRSISAFAKKPVSFEELAIVLRASVGTTEVRSDDDDTRWFLRAYPSGGALYPCEVFCAIWAVDGIPAGIYYYHSLNNELQLVANGNFSQSLLQATSVPDEVANGGVCFVVGATFVRSRFKYGERAYRFALLEAGHIAQNILLTAEAEDLTGLPIGGFNDDLVNGWLGFDGVEQAVLYVIAIGNKQPDDSASPPL